LADVICIGAHVLDVIGGPVDEMPGPGRAALVDEIGITVAGTAGGVAIDLARHDLAVATIGVVGDDVAGRLMASMMHEHGIDTSGLRVHPTLQTSMSMHAIGHDGERRPIHIVGANRSITLDDLVDVAAAGARAVHFGGLDVMPQLWNEAPDLLASWRDAGAVVTLDLLGRVTDMAIDWAAVLTNVDWFLPNDAQLLRLSGTSTPRDAVTWALDRGARHVVMTLGGDGALLATPTELVVVPARDVEVRDTTGCGDAVVGGLIAALLGGLDDATAIELGVVAGSTTARGYGSDAGVAGLDALQAAARDLPVRQPPVSIDEQRGASW
jgi:sugar/nucleoside kinase (ribokinase family)